MSCDILLVANTTGRVRPFELKIVPSDEMKTTRRKMCVFKGMIGGHGAYHFAQEEPRKMKARSLAAELTKAGFSVEIDRSLVQ